MNSYLKRSCGKETEVMETVQNRTTKMISGLQQMPYEERQYQFKLPSLTYRRITYSARELPTYGTSFQQTRYMLNQLKRLSE